MKSKTLLVIALCMIALASCNSPERKEKQFLEGMLSDNVEEYNQALNDFSKWLQYDKSSMDHDFSLMREQMGLKAVYSPDHLLRAYSWVTGTHAGVPAYANVFQWKSGENFVGYCGPIDALIAGRKADITKPFTMPHSLDTIFEIEGGNFPVYLLVQSYAEDDSHYRAYTSAMFINGISLQLLPTFFDGIEYAGNNVYVNDGSINAASLFSYDAATKTFKAYKTDDQDRIIPDQHDVYKLQDHGFARVAAPATADNNQ